VKIINPEKKQEKTMKLVANSRFRSDLRKVINQNLSKLPVIDGDKDSEYDRVYFEISFSKWVDSFAADIEGIIVKFLTGIYNKER
jgi:hypothetical protein